MQTVTPLFHFVVFENRTLTAQSRRLQQTPQAPRLRYAFPNGRTPEEKNRHWLGACGYTATLRFRFLAIASKLPCRHWTPAEGYRHRLASPVEWVPLRFRHQYTTTGFVEATKPLRCAGGYVGIADIWRPP